MLSRYLCVRVPVTFGQQMTPYKRLLASSWKPTWNSFERHLSELFAFLKWAGIVEESSSDMRFSSVRKFFFRVQNLVYFRGHRALVGLLSLERLARILEPNTLATTYSIFFPPKFLTRFLCTTW